MKKTTLSAIYSALKDTDFDAEMLAEIEKELNRGEEQKAKNAELYDEAHAVVIKAMSKLTAPAPISEIFAEVENVLPEGMTKGKFQYAVTRLWTDEIAKTEGKPNTYSLKA